MSMVGRSDSNTRPPHPMPAAILLIRKDIFGPRHHSPAFWRPQRLHDQHQGCRGASTGIVSVVAGKRYRPLVEYRRQSAHRDVFLDEVEGHPCQSMPGQRRGDDHFARVED